MQGLDLLRRQLKDKDRRIEELERKLEGMDAVTRSFDDGMSTGNDSFGSLNSAKSGVGDAIWRRLQTQLNEARAELANKDDLLLAKTASLQLQNARVAELENELKNVGGNDTFKKLKDDCRQLREEKKSLEDQLQAERKEVDDRMQQKNEALAYFRSELQKLKQTQGNDLQRTLIRTSSQHSLPFDTSSVHSSGTASSTVQRAFGGLGSLVSPTLWSKDKADIDARSVTTPRLDAYEF